MGTRGGGIFLMPNQLCRLSGSRERERGGGGGLGGVIFVLPNLLCWLSGSKERKVCVCVCVGGGGGSLLNPSQLCGLCVWASREKEGGREGNVSPLLPPFPGDCSVASFHHVLSVLGAVRAGPLTCAWSTSHCTDGSSI